MDPNLLCKYIVMMERVTETWRNGLKASRTRLFFIFSQTFAIFDDFSKFRNTSSALYFEKSSNMEKLWQKMKNSLVQLGFNPFLHGTESTRNPGFGYPFQH